MPKGFLISHRKAVPDDGQLEQSQHTHTERSHMNTLLMMLAVVNGVFCFSDLAEGRYGAATVSGAFAAICLAAGLT